GNTERNPDPEGNRPLRKGEIRSYLSQVASLFRIHDHSEGKTGEGRDSPGLRSRSGKSTRGRPQPAGAAQAPLPPLGSVRRRYPVYVSGNLRHRLRQVYRGRDSSLWEVRRQYRLRE